MLKIAELPTLYKVKTLRVKYLGALSHYVIKDELAFKMNEKWVLLQFPSENVSVIKSSDLNKDDDEGFDVDSPAIVLDEQGNPEGISCSKFSLGKGLRLIRAVNIAKIS